jgi:hypothetical protein
MILPEETTTITEKKATTYLYGWDTDHECAEQATNPIPVSVA